MQIAIYPINKFLISRVASCNWPCFGLSSDQSEWAISHLILTWSSYKPQFPSNLYTHHQTKRGVERERESQNDVNAKLYTHLGNPITNIVCFIFALRTQPVVENYCQKPINEITTLSSTNAIHFPTSAFLEEICERN